MSIDKEREMHRPRITKFRSNFKYKCRAELAQKLSDCQTNTFEDRQQIYLDTLSKLAPLKTASIRGNSKPHMSKELWKTIMKRTRLKRIANATQSHETGLIRSGKSGRKVSKFEQVRERYGISGNFF